MTDGKDIEQEVMKEESKKQRDKIESEEVKLEKTDLPCPICGKPLYLTKTKRTFAWKCLDGCKHFDSNRPQDIFSHRLKELEALPFLKKIASHLTFVENVPYGQDILLGETRKPQRMKYDAKIYLGSNKLERLKISIIHNCSLEHYLVVEEEYLQGNKKTMEYLGKIGALFIFYFPDDPNTKIAVADCKQVMQFAQEVTDRFGNQQYTLPVQYRKILLHWKEDEISQMLHRNLYKKIFEKRYVI